ncbi:MAG: hypothetical protein WCB11_13910 [Terriglobales bacterium]
MSDNSPIVVDGRRVQQQADGFALAPHLHFQEDTLAGFEWARAYGTVPKAPSLALTANTSSRDEVGPGLLTPTA